MRDENATAAAAKGGVRLAAVQMAMSADQPRANIRKALRLAEQAATRGAHIILLPELFSAQYFPLDAADPRHFQAFARASPLAAGEVEEDGDDDEASAEFWRAFTALARRRAVVLAVSFFERANQTYFNSLAVIDADGSVLAPIYRKTHIPQSPGYHEKFYFAPGDTGACTYRTRYGCVGAAVCWDQWFPELARCMALRGADVLLYPTAIGSEPQDPSLDTCAHWRRVQQGHAAANMVPVVAANRTGLERGARRDDRDGGDGGAAALQISFYGSSFITDATGALVCEADRDTDGAVLVSEPMDWAAQRRARDEWGLFRDRRPDAYTAVCTMDGSGGVRR